MEIKKICQLAIFLMAIPCMQMSGGLSFSVGDEPVISHVHWITVHTGTQETFDSLSNFLTKELQIPVFFGPEKWGKSWYTAIYAGNVILEVCGPFDIPQIGPNERTTRYNTLIFRPFVNGSKSASILQERGLEFEGPSNNALMNVTVSELCSDLLPVHLSDSLHLKARGSFVLDSLQNELRAVDGGPLGLEHMEEVWIGYESEEYLKKWSSFLTPLDSESNMWTLLEKPDLRFIRENRTEIVGLVFKVESIELATEYLNSKGIMGNQEENHIEIDLRKTGGIRIILVE